MYVIWARGFEDINLPMDIWTRSTHRHKRDDHSLQSNQLADSENTGIVMVQLLRADKLKIPERFLYDPLLVYCTPNF